MRVIITVIFLLLSVVVVNAQGRNKVPDEDYLANELVTIRGKVTISRGGESFNGEVNLIFQRVDCKRAFLSVRSDEKGIYEIVVSRGRYKVVSRYGHRVGELIDGLAPDQARIIDATPGRNNEFNIKVIWPYEKVLDKIRDIKIP